MGREFTIIAQYKVPASQAAGYITKVQFQIDPAYGFQDFINVPADRDLLIKDAYVKKEADVTVDATLTFYMDDETVVTSTDPISTLALDVRSRGAAGVFKPFKIPASHKLSAKATTLEAESANADQTITVYLKAEWVPKSAVATAAKSISALQKLKALVRI